MNDKLTIEELKAMCELFFNAGSTAANFQAYFNDVMDGKYDEAIRSLAIVEHFRNFERSVESEMEKFDRQQKIRAHEAMQALSKIILR